MANKQKKKRNKVYRGVDASLDRPVVTRLTAANRSKIGQWWFERKRVLKPVTIATLVIVALVILILEIIRISSGA